MFGNRTELKTALRVAIGVALAAVSFGASAQIEEVIVTAQKVEENILEVPASVTAFSGSDLDNRNVFDVADLEQFTPGL